MPALRPAGLAPEPLDRLVAEFAAELDLTAARETGAREVAVGGITLDSREVQPGDLFAALPGEHAHGVRFLDQAVRAGAVAVLTDPAGAAEVGGRLPLLVAERPRDVLGPMAARIYQNPSSALSLIGVTGTNGKTTTAYLLESGLAAAGSSTILLGTVQTRLADLTLPQPRTTPEAPDLQALLAVAVQRGVRAGAMEVSSHALALGRVSGTRFTVGVFTNLSQDHLDFHGDLERYFAAKASLFRPAMVDTAVICVDDEYGERLMELVRVPQVTCSAAGRPLADWRAVEHRADARGTTVRAQGPAGEDLTLRVPLPGSFNVANALCALAALVATGMDAETAAAGIAAMPGVPGRLEPVVAGQEFTALVDYAHTPLAVRTLLESLRPVTAGRLVVVLGCGGDRDRTKRPLMAQAAVRGADLAVLTSDNPRSEDPERILADMTRGLTGSFLVEPDRAAAIARAVSGLGPGDTLVVAGKGHETGQEVAGTVTPFDDRQVLRAAIAGAGVAP